MAPVPMTRTNATHSVLVALPPLDDVLIRLRKLHLGRLLVVFLRTEREFGHHGFFLRRSGGWRSSCVQFTISSSGGGSATSSSPPP